MVQTRVKICIRGTWGGYLGHSGHNYSVFAVVLGAWPNSYVLYLLSDWLCNLGVISFECRSDGSYLQITHVGLEPAEEEVSESSYTGPVRIPHMLRGRTEHLIRWHNHFWLQLDDTADSSNAWWICRDCQFSWWSGAWYSRFLVWCCFTNAECKIYNRLSMCVRSCGKYVHVHAVVWTLCKWQRSATRRQIHHGMHQIAGSRILNFPCKWGFRIEFSSNLGSYIFNCVVQHW